MPVDKLDLILEIVKKVDEKVDTLKIDNSASHAVLFTQIGDIRKDINGLRQFRTKVLTIASLLAMVISAIGSYLFKKL